MDTCNKISSLSSCSMETLNKPCSTAGIDVYTRELAPIHCIFEITGFSTKGTKGEAYGSDIFEAGGCKWSLCLYPCGNKKQRGGEGHISLYLNIEETNKFTSGWEVLVHYKLFVYDQHNDCYLTIQDARGGAVRRFHERKKQWGFTQLISLENLRNCSNGYLVDDTCIFGAEVCVLKATSGKLINPKPSTIIISQPQSNSTQDDEADKNDHRLVICEPMPSSVGTKTSLPAADAEIGKPNKLPSSVGGTNNIAVPAVGTGEPYLPSETDGVEMYWREQPPTHYSLEINQFSQLGNRAYWSDMFEAGGFVWSLTVYPNGNKEQGGEGHISLYLRLEESSTLPAGWEAFVNYKLMILDKTKGCYLTVQDAQGKVRRFHKNIKEWGFAKFISLERLKQGYLDKDTCVLGAEVFMMQSTGKRGILNLNRGPPQITPNKITFTLDNFSTLDSERYESQIGTYGDCKWRLRVYPKGKFGSDFGNSLSVFLIFVEGIYIGYSKHLVVSFELRVLDQLNVMSSTWSGPSFNEGDSSPLISLEDLHKPANGFICSDTVIIQVEFSRCVVR